MGVVKKEGEYSWIRYTHQRIEKNKNALYTISGPTGSGKSWSALMMCLLNDPSFTAKRCVFTAKELMNLINSDELRKGSAVMFDEAGIEMNSRTWNSITNKMLNYLIQTFRHRNIILIFTSPYLDFIDSATRKLFHAEFETLYINPVNKTCSLKPKLLQYNSERRKFYRKYLRVRGNGHGYIPLKRWSIPKPPMELVNAYEIKKGEFTRKLNERIVADLEKVDVKKRPRYLHTCDYCDYMWEGLAKEPKWCPTCRRRLKYGKNPKKTE